ncbi:neuronal acetylcholine receptor subunit alpha-9-like isoform X2 [Actinia tenebrosa]|uniref:Neuronal acetylcholine receptor subunit alpha-9-like isoform X2 n=1 Tax=Actinia tenebrosa TaxID=6105 RepID=A0A6P8IDE2_ACTTE|nr:neuronal acetylcholine receptor subunit alpha-9-like isoform X2 [Actinia tenebrosa]
MKLIKRVPTSFWRAYLCFYTGIFVLFYELNPRFVEGSTFEMESKLIEYLLNGNRSSKRVRPVKNGLLPINITMDMTLSNVIDMDEVRQMLSLNMWIQQNWTNEIMAWNPDDFDGIKSISLEASDIWLPDTILYNNVFEEFDGRLDNVKTRVRLGYRGDTKWTAPFIFKTLCKINVQNFPFDRQQCKLKFGSWQYDVKELDLLVPENGGHLDSNRIKNGEWDVLNVEVQRNELEYGCCPPVVYPDITFILTLKRRSLFYMFNLIIPNFLIALLAFFSFYIPVECGERISFVMTVLLSMFVFLLLVAESIPPTSEAVPTIGVYFTSSIVLVALALIATGFVLKINYMYIQLPCSTMSPKLRWLLFQKLGPVLGFQDSTRFVVKTKSSSELCPKHQLQRDDRITANHSTNDEPTIYYQNGSKKGSKRKKISCNELPSGSDEEGSVSLVLSEIYPDVEISCSQRKSIGSDVHAIATAVSSHEQDNTKSMECRLAAAIVDRVFMIIFIVVFLFSTFVILFFPYLSSE